MCDVSYGFNAQALFYAEMQTKKKTNLQGQVRFYFSTAMEITGTYTRVDPFQHAFSTDHITEDLLRDLPLHRSQSSDLETLETSLDIGAS